MYEIEDDIPPPPQIRGKYPFGLLNIGQSFFVPCDENDKRGALLRVSNTAGAYGRRHGRRYVTRTINDPPGVRVWRIDDPGSE